MSNDTQHKTVNECGRKSVQVETLIGRALEGYVKRMRLLWTKKASTFAIWTKKASTLDAASKLFAVTVSAFLAAKGGRMPNERIRVGRASMRPTWVTTESGFQDVDNTKTSKSVHFGRSNMNRKHSGKGIAKLLGVNRSAIHSISRKIFSYDDLKRIGAKGYELTDVMAIATHFVLSPRSDEKRRAIAGKLYLSCGLLLQEEER